VGAKEGYEFHFPLSTDLLVKRHDISWTTLRQLAVLVLFWGCITYYGVEILVAIHGNMNTDKYISVLDDNLWPVVVRHLVFCYLTS
jgi:hypothetical protein